MARETGPDGPFQGVDGTLTIYALANGMELTKEPGTRRLGWYRDGREREVRIARADGSPGFVVSAWAGAGRSGPDAEPAPSAVEQPVDRVPTAQALAERLTALVERARERADAL